MTIGPSVLQAVIIALALSRLSNLQAQAPPDSTDLPPAGLGTLRSEDVSIRLAAGSVQLRVLPLSERIIRLLAPDSYSSFHQLPAVHAAEIQRLAAQRGLRRPQLFLVTFFGLAPRAQFNPEEITITSQNRLFRPGAIFPLSPQWSELQLGQRETASAIYLFEDGIVLLEPLTVSYGGASSSQWEQLLRDIEIERARVYSRAATTPVPE